MSASNQQSSFNDTTHLNPSTNGNQSGISANTAGSATAFGRGDHPDDRGNTSPNVKPSSSKWGVQPEDVEGEQMATLAEGKVMDAQLHKREVGGWGEGPDNANDLERKKEEQADAREEIKRRRDGGEPLTVDGGEPREVSSEDNSAV